MCGLAGVVGNIPKINFKEILNSLKYRGPDYNSYILGKKFVFFHSLLKIMDLSNKSQQPMYDELTGNYIIFNGSIYNYKEIKKKLLINEKFQSDSDTEVILKLYKIYGKNLTKHIRGMFAFAIYDKHKNKIFLFRDFFGIKPLYYSIIDNVLYFASEIKILTKFDKVKKNLSLDSYSALSFISYRHLLGNNSTLFKNIKSLPAGSFLEIELDTFKYKIKRYISIDKTTQRNENINHKNFEKIFLENIRNHLITKHKKVACLLSGGLDSSVLIASIRNISKNLQISTYTAIEKNSIEAKNAKKINKIYNLTKNYINIDNINFFDKHKKITKIIDQPLTDASMIIHNILCEKVSKDGFKVLFSGNGADEIFYGYPGHINGYFAKLLRNNLFYFIQRIINFRKYNSKNTFLVILRSIYENFPLKIKNFYKRFIIKKKISHLNLEKLDLNNLNFYEDLSSDLFENINLNYKNKWALQNYLDYEDKNSMNYGIECRVPYLDIHFIDLIKNTDLKHVFDVGTKSLIRRMSFIPNFLKSERKKIGFAGDLFHYLEKDKKKIKNEIEKEFDNIPMIDKKKLLLLGNNLNKKNFEIFFRTYSFGIWYNANLKDKI